MIRCIAYFAMICSIGLFGQNSTIQELHSLNAGGGSSISTNGSITYSLGQVFIAPLADSYMTMTPGVQQAVEGTNTFAVTGQEPTLAISAYPNPMVDYLVIDIQEAGGKNLAYQIFDVHGRIIEENPINNSKTRIDPANLVSAVYLLRVTEEGIPIKTFRISKS